MEHVPIPLESVASPTRSLPARLAPVVLILVAMGLAFAFRLDKVLTFDQFVASREALRAAVATHGALSFLIFVALYAATVAISLPGASLMTLAGGFLFGAWIGGSLSAIGATLGGSALFWAASTSFGEPLRRRAGGAITKLQAGFQENAISYLLFLRLAPVFPFWFVNLGTAMLGVPFRTFLWTTFIGILPGTFAYAFLGAGLDKVILNHEKAVSACRASGMSDCARSLALSDLVTKEILIAFVALAFVALLPVLWKHLARQKTNWTDTKAPLE